MIHSVGCPRAMRQAARWCNVHKKMHVRSRHGHVKTTRRLWWRCVRAKTRLCLHGGLS